MTPVPRIAVFDARFEAGLSGVILRDEQVSELPESEFETVAAGLPLLLRMEPLSWRPSFPLVAFSSESRILTDEDRNFLWNAFGVPVFEQILDGRGQVVASECEAHEGFHLSRGARLRIGGMRLIEDLCNCGIPGVRMIYAAPEARLSATA